VRPWPGSTPRDIPARPGETFNMTRALLATLCLILLAAPPAFAGRIFGDIKMDGKPLPQSVPVLITVPLAAEAKTGARADSTSTDKFGSYKLNVKDNGRCILTVMFEKQTLELTVFSYKEATRYDLILEKKDGKLSLRRK
jgi:hypothetical protein